MALLKVEQETIILFNEAETTASVYTHNAALQRVLLELCQTHPAQVRQTEDNRCGGLTFELPKKWVKISPPRALSEAQKPGFGRDEPAQSGAQAISIIIWGGME